MPTLKHKIVSDGKEYTRRYSYKLSSGDAEKLGSELNSQKALYGSQIKQLVSEMHVWM